jgi:hypothetical protein
MTAHGIWLSPGSYRVDLVEAMDGHWIVHLRGRFETASAAEVIRGVLYRLRRATNPVHLVATEADAFGPTAAAAIRDATTAPAPAVPMILDAASLAVTAALVSPSGTAAGSDGDVSQMQSSSCFDKLVVADGVRVDIVRIHRAAPRSPRASAR